MDRKAIIGIVGLVLLLLLVIIINQRMINGNQIALMNHQKQMAKDQLSFEKLVAIGKMAREQSQSQSPTQTEVVDEVIGEDDNKVVATEAEVEAEAETET